MTLPETGYRPQIGVEPSTECWRLVAPGSAVKCFCDNTLSYTGPHTEALIRAQAGSTGPSSHADEAIKCRFCKTIVELHYRRLG